jgi:hypothetical protein
VVWTDQLAVTMTESPGNTRLVPSSHNGWESYLLVMAIISLVSITLMNAYFLGRTQQDISLHDWQISAYSDLVGVDQAIYQEMATALEEIFDLHLSLDYWPEQPEFEAHYLPPFFRDATWQRNGAVFWLMRDSTPADSSDGVVLYHGTGGNIPGQGSYLILINHGHAGTLQLNDATFWWHPDPDSETPEQPTLSSLIIAGWRQIIAYTGEDERMRLR